VFDLDSRAKRVEARVRPMRLGQCNPTCRDAGQVERAEASLSAPVIRSFDQDHSPADEVVAVAEEAVVAVVVSWDLALDGTFPSLKLTFLRKNRQESSTPAVTSARASQFNPTIHFEYKSPFARKSGCLDSDVTYSENLLHAITDNWKLVITTTIEETRSAHPQPKSCMWTTVDSLMSP